MRIVTLIVGAFASSGLVSATPLPQPAVTSLAALTATAFCKVFGGIIASGICTAATSSAPKQPAQSFKPNGSGLDGWQLDYTGKSLPSTYPTGFLYFGVTIGWAPPKFWPVPSDNWVPPAVIVPQFPTYTWWAPASSWVPPSGFKIPSFWPGLGWHKPTKTSAPPAATATFKPLANRCTSQLTLSSTWNVNARPQVRLFDFTVSEAWGNPDGLFRKMFVVNNCYEGPLIEANQGDTIIVNVHNKLSESTALHWHGMAQNGTGWADGPNGITQCPINPGESFTYKFVLDRPDQYGTYWWHAHRSAQYADGLTGPLIIHSPKEPLQRGRDYTVDQVVLVKDWYHDMSDKIVADLLTAAGYQGTFIAPSPNSGLINGRGTYNCSLAPVNTTCVTLPPAELTVPPNAKVRLRFINDGAHAFFKMSVDNHPFTVVEADDTPVTHPGTVHRIPFGVAQRYSVIIDTSADKNGDSFIMRAQINTDCFGAPFLDLNPDVIAYIRVVSPGRLPSTAAPTTVDWTDETVDGPCVDLDEHTLVPVQAVNPPAVAGAAGVFNVSFLFTQTGVFEWTLNAVSLENFIYNPLLFQVFKGQSLDATKVSYVQSNTVQGFDLIVNNQIGADHPFHLHAMQFYIIARGTGSAVPSDIAGMTLQLTNPLRRDVTTIPAGTYAVLRIVTDIPGVHAFHCHIAFHQAAGLFGVFVVQPDAVKKQNIPAAAFNLCAASNYLPGESIDTTEPGRRRRRSLGAAAAPLQLSS